MKPEIFFSLSCATLILASPAMSGKSPCKDIDATFLSTQKAGGFVGTLLGLYAFGAHP